MSGSNDGIVYFNRTAEHQRPGKYPLHTGPVQERDIDITFVTKKN